MLRELQSPVAKIYLRLGWYDEQKPPQGQQDRHPSSYARCLVHCRVLTLSGSKVHAGAGFSLPPLAGLGRGLHGGVDERQREGPGVGRNDAGRGRGIKRKAKAQRTLVHSIDHGHQVGV